MAKNSSNANSIVAINKVTQTIFGLSGNEIFEHDFGRSSRAKETYVSYIPFKDVITTTIEIPRTVEEADLLDTIVIKVYEELGLDATLDYKITYLEVVGASGDERVFNVFVVDNQLLNTEFDAIAARTGYLDYVAIAPFLYEGLYSRGLLTKEGTDCFIYLQRDDAFLVVYQNGEYFQSRQLRYNLKFLNDKFSELIGNKLEENTFNMMLSTYGANLESPAERDYMVQIFDDMFYYINDIITSLNKIYNIQIQNVYFGSDIGKIPGVNDFVESILKLTYKEFNFSVAKNAKEFELTQLDTLMFLAAQNYLANKDEEHNYSPFKRPPPISQRTSGKLIGYVLLGLLLGAAYPLYQYGHGYYNSLISDQKEAEYAKTSAELNRVKGIDENLNKQITQTREDFARENDILTKRLSLLDGILDKKINYAMKAVAIHDLSNMVTNNQGSIQKIENDDRNLTINVNTRNDKQMTELLKNISETRPYSVYTKSIILDEKDKSAIYDSNVSVEVQ